MSDKEEIEKLKQRLDELDANVTKLSRMVKDIAGYSGLEIRDIAGFRCVCPDYKNSYYPGNIIKEANNLTALLAEKLGYQFEEVPAQKAKTQVVKIEKEKINGSKH